MSTFSHETIGVAIVALAVALGWWRWRGRLERERQRFAAERLLLLGRLAAGVGHEINNPLCVVKGNVACALEALDRERAAPHVREALAEALLACDRIARVTTDMRALAGQAGAPPIELGRLLGEPPHDVQDLGGGEGLLHDRRPNRL